MTITKDMRIGDLLQMNEMIADFDGQATLFFTASHYYFLLKSAL